MRVLIVDDEAGIREILKRYLLVGGFETTEAEGADQALAQLDRGEAIDVAFVDLQMPGHGGLWLVEQMRDRFPEVAIVLATADVEVPGTISLQPGVVGYLVKPFTAETVGTALTSATDWLSTQRSSARLPTSDPVEDWLNRAKGLRADQPKRPH